MNSSCGGHPHQHTCKVHHRGRIAELPAKDRAPWTAYLDRSQKQMRIDRAVLAAERTPGLPEPPQPKESFSARSIPLHREAAWYATPEARHIADVIVSFQTPAGGWSKNLDMAGSLRLRGQSYTAGDLSKYSGAGDFDAPRDPNWNYVGTLDNDATNTQLHFLALVSAATPGKAGEPYRASFLKGIRYLLAAQFPNGGWPQIGPLQAVITTPSSTTTTPPPSRRRRSPPSLKAAAPTHLCPQTGAAARHALDCLLATQVVIDGKRTLWAQHDALTLAPVAARNYEPAALATGESAALLLCLMQLPHPSPAVVPPFSPAWPG